MKNNKKHSEIESSSKLLDSMIDEVSTDDSSDENVKKRSKKEQKAIDKLNRDLNKSSKQRKVKPHALAIAGACALVLVGGVTFGVLQWGSDIFGEQEAENKKTQAIGTDVDALLEKEHKAFESKQGDENYPVNLADWQKDVPGSSDTVESVIGSYYGSDLDMVASVLPSEAAGFTSNQDENVLDGDGTPNPMYSFWTRESFLYETGIILEKFLNPEYGSWYGYQFADGEPENIDVRSHFSRVFTNAALENKAPLREWLPIYADWDSNDYGVRDLPLARARWFGKVESVTADFAWSDQDLQYTVNMVANVKYTSYLNSGERVTKDGVLELELVANPSGEKGEGGRVLVNKSKLTVD